ncbi:MAG: hypothetical protein ABL921_35235 [Pirellula sp.]
MNPTCWHPITWFLFLLWLTFGIAGNFPPRLSPDGKKFATYPQPVASMHRLGFFCGWPLKYVPRVVVNGTTGIIVVETRNRILALNIAIIVVTLISLVILMQRVKQFSIRSIFAAICLIAFLLAMNRLPATFNTIASARHFVMIGIYFAPIFILSTVELLSFMRRRKICALPDRVSKQSLEDMYRHAEHEKKPEQTIADEGLDLPSRTCVESSSRPR